MRLPVTGSSYSAACFMRSTVLEQRPSPGTECLVFPAPARGVASEVRGCQSGRVHWGLRRPSQTSPSCEVSSKTRRVFS